MKKYEHILFDMDGTLIDSVYGITESICVALNKMNINVPAPDILRKMVGPPLKEGFISVCGLSSSDADRAVTLFRSYYSEKGMYNVKLYDGTVEMLNILSECHKLYIATSKPTVFTVSIAKHLNIEQYFTGIAGSNLDNTGSKKDEIIRFILEKYKINAADAIMIGDKRQDMYGALRCGLDSVGVTYGYGTVEELELENTVKIVSTPDELSGLLE